MLKSNRWKKSIYDTWTNRYTYAYRKFYDDTSTILSSACKKWVTTIVAEPHEIANVFGDRGIYAMIEAENNIDTRYFMEYQAVFHQLQKN